MKYLYLLITILVFTSCEDVIDLPLEEGPKLLVIDANINWIKNSSGKSDGSIQSIKLTETAGFYDLTVPIATGALVKITDSSKEYIFTEQDATGIYSTTTFEPQLNENYTLTIEYKDEVFTAEETMIAIADITSVEQSIVPVFGEDLIRVDFNYTDPLREENYYLNQFTYIENIADTFRTYSDEFIDGNDDSVFYQSEDLIAGEKLKLHFYGASKTYHNYFYILLQQIQSGGPFSTPPASVKGNCINVTNPDKKPLGYFRLSEVFIEEYTIK